MIGFVTELPTVNICEEVYAWGYNTGGNYWWIGTMSGYHEIDMKDGTENEQARSSKVKATDINYMFNNTYKNS